MPGVTNVRLVPTVEGADRSHWMPDSESYVSPDGRLKLVLGKPGEVRMGLGVWTEARLFEDGAERTRRHEVLLEVVGNRLLPQSCYVPWDSSSQHLMLAHLIDDGGQLAVGVVVYDVNQRAVVHQNHRSGWLRTIAWSPTQELALLLTDDAARVMSGHGESWVVARGVGAVVDVGGWTRTGAYTFFTARTRDGTEVLRFVSPEKGEIVLDCAIQPEALVPYDAAAYKSLGRQRYVLVNGPGERAVAELLDRWSVGRFDPSTQVLSLGVMRPASGLQMVPAFTGPGGPTEEPGCSAALRWIDADVVE